MPKSLLAFVCLIALAPNALAHATLLRSDPVPGSDLAAAPARVRLTFDERVEPVFNSLSVISLAGHRVDNGDVHVADDGSSIEVALAPLSAGPYVVLWKVNSADGHQVHGEFGFGVRSAAPDDSALQRFVLPEQSVASKSFGVFVKWMILTALVIWLGGIFFLLQIVSGARDTERSLPHVAIIEQRSLRLLLAMPFVYIACELEDLLAQTLTFSGLSLAKSLSAPTLAAVLFHTTYGEAWLARMACAGVLCILLLFAASTSSDEGVRRSASVAVAAPFFGGAILLTFPLSGHATAVPRLAWLAVLCDWCHLVATTVWIGGLVHLAFAVAAIECQDHAAIEFLGRMTARFSRFAKASVIVLLVTGVYAAWLHLPDWASFVTTAYGRTLFAKIGLVILILSVAAINLRRVVPALLGVRAHFGLARLWATRFAKLLRLEIAMGLAILLLVALLTSLPPASAVAAGPINLTRSSPQGGVTVNLTPNRVGSNQVIVTLFDSSGHEVTNAASVNVYLQMRDMDMALDTIPAQREPDGTYRALVDLSMAGRWRLSVEVSPERGDDFFVDFDFSSGF